MEEGRPSSTAMMAAILRAAHVLLDDEPKILQDELALRLSGFANEAALQAAVNALLAEISHRSNPELAHALFRYARTFVVLRNRYAEDALSQAIARGVSQYVMLGAGLDSFAYRRPDLEGVVQIFEVDHPATQRWKQTRLRDLTIPLPHHLTFVPLDFEQQTLVDTLQRSTYQMREPAFFSWLGVTEFLTEDAVFRTLKEVAALAPGSELVFQYSPPEVLMDAEAQPIIAEIKATSAARGEPWLSLFEPLSFAARVKAVGFTQVQDFGAEDANARYFAGRSDGLRMPNAQRLMKVRVGHVA